MDSSAGDVNQASCTADLLILLLQIYVSVFILIANFMKLDNYSHFARKDRHVQSAVSYLFE